MRDVRDIVHFNFLIGVNDMTKPARLIEQQLTELIVCVGSSSINVVLGVIFSIGLFVRELVSNIKKNNRFSYKLLPLLIVKLCVLLSYPLTILTLTKYQSLFITTLLFGRHPRPIDGFGAAVVLFILHLTVNIKLHDLYGGG